MRVMASVPRMGRRRGARLGMATAVVACAAVAPGPAHADGLSFEGAAAAYPARLLDLPSMREWYASGLAEAWREPDHEAEVRAAGMIVEDLRATA